ncbi:hypothetical protein KM043_001105 [Ampulex compressa]|nr:hypothetical protein KM043_001105 [Ampulex compressa]
MSSYYVPPTAQMPQMQDGTIATAPIPGIFSIPPPGAPIIQDAGWSQQSTICPPGLEYLMALDYLFVNQKIEFIEALVGWETENKYAISNIRGEQVYYAREKSHLLSRMCCGPIRDCEIRIHDGLGKEVLRMVRPLRCNSCCYPCCLQVMEVYSGGCLLGSVVQEWSLCKPYFSIRDASDKTVLTIIGPCIRRCVEATFQVKSADEEHKVGVIKKKWSGIGRELLTDCDLFGIRFPVDLDVKIKAVLLGAALLIDYMYFEM